MKPHLSNIQKEDILTLSSRVAEEIMSFYQSDYTVTIKKDNSPATQADIAASHILEQGLPRIANYPVLSEENAPQAQEWLNWETYWLIDPIDGTKQFINKTGDFCICIALIHKNQPILGLIYEPITHTAWFSQYGDNHVSKFYNGVSQPISLATPTLVTATIGTRKPSNDMSRLLSVLNDYDWFQRGSALKYIDIIEGKAHIYPKIWDTCEWDSAAGQCIIECAGGQVLNFQTGQPLQYGMKESLINPHFLSYAHIPQKMVHELLASYKNLNL